MVRVGVRVSVDSKEGHGTGHGGVSQDTPEDGPEELLLLGVPAVAQEQVDLTIQHVAEEVCLEDAWRGRHGARAQPAQQQEDNRRNDAEEHASAVVPEHGEAQRAAPRGARAGGRARRTPALRRVRHALVGHHAVSEQQDDGSPDDEIHAKLAHHDEGGLFERAARCAHRALARRELTAAQQTKLLQAAEDH